MRARGWTMLLAATVLAAGLAGCVGGDGPAAPQATDQGDQPAAPSDPQAVVAVIDSGINPYHRGFRDQSPLAHAHPSTYIDGYPPDATALNLTLDAPDWASAVEADCELWNGLQGRHLYWVPGTRVIGIWLDLGWDEFTVDCDAGERPLKGLDTLAPHGSMASGRAAGADTSLCPDCRIVAVQMGPNTVAMKWAADQPWIDVQSNSWIGYACHMVDRPRVLCNRGPRELAREATEQQVVFAGSGNGVRSTVTGVGVAAGVGVPTYLSPAQAHEGVIVVGGHDNGELVLWPGTMPHVVADVEDTPSTAWHRLEGGIFNGTSSSTPFAAGVFAGMLVEARRMVGDTGTGLRGDDLVIAADDAELPASGPLADGRLSRSEAERLYMVTAQARPSEDLPFDGEIGCPPVDCISVSRGNNLLPWSEVPEQVPAYYFVGYGQVGTQSLAAAMEVLRGNLEQPQRPIEDQFFDIDSALRRTLQE